MGSIITQWVYSQGVIQKPLEQLDENAGAPWVESRCSQSRCSSCRASDSLEGRAKDSPLILHVG